MKVMMYGHDGSLNRGCEAIVRSTTNMLKEKNESTKVILASGKPETDNIISKIDEVFDSKQLRFNPSIVQKARAFGELKLFKRENYMLGKIHENVISRIDDIDVFLSIGGDNYCYGEQPGFYEINRRVKQKGKKLVMWGCSIGEEDISERKLKDLITFDLILARETLTYDMLTGKGLTNVKLVSDPAFTMEKQVLPLPNGWKYKDTIGLNFSPLVANKNRESEESVRGLIKHILNKTSSTIALTPHVVIDGNNDYEILKKYYDEFKSTGRVILLPQDLNATQYKGFISRMRVFIGARTHATIAAYSTSVPTMVLGYSIKSRGIAKDLFGFEKLVLGIDEISNLKKLRDTFDELIKDEKEIKKHLDEIIPEVKKMAYRAVEYLNELTNK